MSEPMSRRPFPRATRLAVVALIAGLSAVLAFADTATGAASPLLARYPYLTDSVQSSITLNWATTATGTATATYGPVGSCGLNTVTASRTGLQYTARDGTSVVLSQWKAVLPVSPGTAYCYRVFLGTTDLLGTDPSPQFTSQVAQGSATPFSFAVFGDWGQSYAGGANPDQANVLRQMANSGARFAVMTGDTAYQGAGQREYGDLQHPDVDQSAVFGPGFWEVPGRSLPVFNVTGNHGFTNGKVQVDNWPEGNAASTSGGKYQMEPYSVNGATGTYPSFWYAFDAGPARFYALTTAWADSNYGTSSGPYETDRDAHWLTSSAEYQWLANDLAAHPNALKFAFWHYPLHSESNSQPSDTFLQGGPGTLQGLLNAHHVAIAFNGHAHGYHRFAPDSGGMVSYVFGNGGAALGSVRCGEPSGRYAIGAGGTHCGAAPAGLTDDRVFGFGKVTVNGNTVTVAPTDQYGNTYDVQTYTFPGNAPDTQPPTTPGGLTGTALSGSSIRLNWAASTDNVGVTGYRVYRNGTLLTTVSGSTLTYTDTTAAASTTYTYEVGAVDAANLESSPRASVGVTTPAGGPTLTFAPSDDATVDSSQPTVNFGTNSRLTVDNSPLVHSLLKFTVAGTSGCPVAGAKLRLTVGSGTDDKSVYGGDVYGTTNGWSQGTVTYNTAPAAGTKAGSVSGAVANDASYLFDVTPLVTGDGTVSFLVKSTNADGARYLSQESGTATTAPQLQVTCGTTVDSTAPTRPGSLTASSPTGSAVTLNWAASTDNVGVTGYRVYRGGSPPATVDGSTLTYTDSTVSASTAYTYQVTAVDAAGNESTPASVSVTTGASGTLTFGATDDATVDASRPTIPLGAGSRITVDNSPVDDALVKFTVSGLNGCAVTAAKLRLTVGSAADDTSVYGGDVYGTTNGWSQGTVTYDTAPAAGTRAGSVTGPVALDTAYLFDVTPLVTGDGTVSFRVKSTAGDGARYVSTEGGTTGTGPQLLVTC
jgi:chitodextrinase